jgi:hypothetical protein
MARVLVLQAEDIDDALIAAMVLAASLRSTGDAAQVGVFSDDPFHHLLIDTILGPCHRLHDHGALPPGNYTLLISTTQDSTDTPSCRVRPISADALYIEGIGRVGRRPLPTMRRVTDLLGWRQGAEAMRRRLMRLATPPVQTAHLSRATPAGPADGPPTHRIAVAHDDAFTLPRPALLHHLRQRGAQFIPFSPLHDEAVPDADATLLCAVAPELYAAELASNDQMRASLRDLRHPILALEGAALYLGEGVYNLDGAANPMVGRLPDQWRQLERARVGPTVHAELLGHTMHGRPMYTSELLTSPDGQICSAESHVIAWEEDGCLASLTQPTQIDWPHRA